MYRAPNIATRTPAKAITETRASTFNLARSYPQSGQGPRFSSIYRQMCHDEYYDDLEDRLATRQVYVPHVEPCNLGDVRFGLAQLDEYPDPVGKEHPEPLGGKDDHHDASRDY